VLPRLRSPVSFVPLPPAFMRHLTAIILDNFTHDRWTVRPLQDEYLSYAVKDALLIARLYWEFESKDYIKEMTLLEQSSRYLAQHKSCRPPMNSGHPLLPLEILSVPNILSSTRACGTCTRSLSSGCFPSNGSNCMLCRAYHARPPKYRR
jgi:exonuclease 3'-5' domain-containing protein 1